MPKVSVILPVYNGEKYLKEAIDSILAQTFTDFELLLLNDGSTDSSEAIIYSYDDPRIVYSKNEKNSGLIFTLNKAIQLANGEYIARMDADDVALPERLQKQVDYLQTHTSVGVVATTIIFIDDDKKQTGFWALDQTTFTSQAIRNAMPWRCCIAHPSVLGRAEIFRRFLYSEVQKNIEDYDLWLRILDDDIQIAKIFTPALLYRLHPESVTQTNKRASLPLKRILWCKARYLKQAFKTRRFSLFNLKVASTMFVDFIIIAKKSVVS